VIGFLFFETLEKRKTMKRNQLKLQPKKHSEDALLHYNDIEFQYYRIIKKKKCAHCQQFKFTGKDNETVGIILKPKIVECAN
jgi:hypothetical protein